MSMANAYYFKQKYILLGNISASIVSKNHIAKEKACRIGWGCAGMMKKGPGQ